MPKIKKFLSALMCFVLIMVCTFTVSADSVKKGFINGTGVHIRESATTSSDSKGQVSNAEVVINSTTEGQEVTTGIKTWYNITYNGITGFVYGEFVVEYPSEDDYVYSEDFEENLLNFPESYRDALRALHSKYKNWKFIAVSVPFSFDEAVNNQYGSTFSKNRKHVEGNYYENEWRDMRAYDSATGIWSYPNTTTTRWMYASRSAIAYYMDPRNSLVADKIFVFAQHSYDKTSQTEEKLRTVVSGTFLANGYDINGVIDTEAYIKDIMYAAEYSGVSPYVIAANILIEQGEGKSHLISGKCEDYGGEYKGYYNFFNIGASDEGGAVYNGLVEAKNRGWDSQRKSIAEGAAFYNGKYISAGQDTFYFMNFNLVNLAEPWRQYATSLYDASNKASKLASALISNYDAAIEFRIPVFNSMPESASQRPTPGDENIYIEPVVPKGDVNMDSSINAIDLAAVKMHILDVQQISGNGVKAADVNNDGLINAIDLAAIKMHILGVQTIS